MHSKRSFILLVAAVVIILVVVVAIVAGKSSDTSDSDMSGMDMSHMSSGDSSDTKDAVATNSVNITNYMFGPKDIKVKVGTKVTWTNKDSVHHTVTSDSGKTLDSPEIGQGKTFSYTFKKAGTYTYHCMPHPYMHGTVVVTN